MKTKVGVIGYGHLGRWHTQKADSLENCELVAIVEPSTENVKKAQEAYPNVKVVQKLDEVINEIDAAVVVTPTSFHFDVVKTLLENKKHIFCEKPLCSNSEETKSLEKLVDENLTLQVGHSERCHEAWEILSPKLREVKGPSTVKIDRYAPFKGRATDVDVVQDLMIHDIDLILFTLQKRPVSLSAVGHKIRTDKWDHVTCTMNFEDGSCAIVTSGRNHVQEVRAFELMHDGGCFYVDLFANTISEATSSEFEDGSFVKSSSYEKRDHLLIEQTNFYNAILGKEKPMVNFSDGAIAVYLVEKVLESLELKEEVKLQYN